LIILCKKKLNNPAEDAREASLKNPPLQDIVDNSRRLRAVRNLVKKKLPGINQEAHYHDQTPKTYYSLFARAAKTSSLICAAKDSSSGIKSRRG